MIYQPTQVYFILLLGVLSCIKSVKNQKMAHGVTILENKDIVIEDLCKIIEKTAQESIEKHGTFSVGLSGGSLVSFLVTGLPKVKSDFTKWKLFFCDERLVPVDDPESTFGVYKRQLVDTKAVNITADQFVILKQGVSADEAAKDYEEQIKNLVPLNPLPQFDLLLLGMGPDGHTCSLFPGHKLVQETNRWVAPITDSPKPPPSRITLTFPVLNNARVCVFAIAGKEKAEMAKRIHVNKEKLPAGLVQPTNGQVYWLVDKDAGSLLD
ncbi:6-phosphogluconolactonase [Anthonomus grandis grandis]|uniref:6-phosphogluconolactonase n=1 Tax=Anthonomus grandis grandis TaxID=2921223 RepID=UPI002164FDC4|nr:6-phosphogluconolactonase [Anthonomus grandis grandis]